MNPKACFTVNDRFCLWKICQGSCIPGIWSSRDCLMLMDFLEDFCGVPQAWGRLAVDAIRRPQSDFSRPLASWTVCVCCEPSFCVFDFGESDNISRAESGSLCLSLLCRPRPDVLVLGPLPEAPIIKSEQPGCRARRHRFSNLSARKGLRLLRLLSPGPLKPGWVFTSPGKQDKLSPSFLNLSVSQGRGPGSSVLVVVLSESDSYFLYSV